jgi:putative thioredoxin
MSEAAHPDWIIETSDATFEQDVIERSKEKPVVLDFWATWCQPCLMLKPILEELAKEYQGRFVLVKAEQQSNGKALEEFRVEAYPTVFGVVGGHPVDYFMGLMRPAQLRQWIDRLLETAELSRAEQLEESDPAAAELEYRRRLEANPEDARLLTGLARVLLSEGKREESREVITRLESRGYLEPEAEKIKAALDLAGGEGGSVVELREQVRANPRDYELRVRLAQALAAQGEYEEALAAALEVVEEDLTGAREAARKLMLEIFQVLPGDSSLKTAYQRKLSAALY